MNDEEIVSKLEEYITELEKMVEPCNRGILRINEVRNCLTRIRDSTMKMLTDDTTSFRLYDRHLRDRLRWFNATLSGYIDTENCSYITEEMNILKELIKEIKPQESIGHIQARDEVHFQEGELVESANQIFKIMLLAKESLRVIDAYVDNTLFDFVCSLDSDLTIQILTKSTKPIFDRLLYLSRDEEMYVEAKQSDSIHDRYIIIDNKDVWHLGASIKDAGRKDFTIKKLSNQEAVNKIIARFQEEWVKSNPIE